MSTSDLIALGRTIEAGASPLRRRLMVDHDIYGRAERISLKAPVPVIHIEREERTLGAAGTCCGI